MLSPRATGGEVTGRKTVSSWLCSRTEVSLVQACQVLFNGLLVIRQRRTKQKGGSSITWNPWGNLLLKLFKKMTFQAKPGNISSWIFYISIIINPPPPPPPQIPYSFLTIWEINSSPPLMTQGLVTDEQSYHAVLETTDKMKYGVGWDSLQKKSCCLFSWHNPLCQLFK